MLRPVVAAAACAVAMAAPASTRQPHSTGRLVVEVPPEGLSPASLVRRGESRADPTLQLAGAAGPVVANSSTGASPERRVSNVTAALTDAGRENATGAEEREHRGAKAVAIRGLPWPPWTAQPDEPFPVQQRCYLKYCNAFPDLKDKLCDGYACTSQAQLAKCKDHWYAYGRTEGRLHRPDLCNDNITKGCFLSYCNAYGDLRESFCSGGRCAGETQAAACKWNWYDKIDQESQRAARPDKCNKIQCQSACETLPPDPNAKTTTRKPSWKTILTNASNLTMAKTEAAAAWTGPHGAGWRARASLGPLAVVAAAIRAQLT